MSEERVWLLNNIKQRVKEFFPIFWLILAYCTNLIFDMSDNLNIDRATTCHYLSIAALILGIVEFFNSLVAFCEFQIFQHNNSLIDLDGKNHCITIENGNTFYHTYELTEEQKKFPIRFNIIKKIFLIAKYAFILISLSYMYCFGIGIQSEKLAVFAFSILCCSIYMNKKFSEHYKKDYCVAEMLAKEYKK